MCNVKEPKGKDNAPQAKEKRGGKIIPRNDKCVVCGTQLGAGSRINGRRICPAPDCKAEN